MRDQLAMGNSVLMAVLMFDIVKYTSDKRPPLLKDCFLGVGGFSSQFSLHVNVCVGMCKTGKN